MASGSRNARSCHRSNPSSLARSLMALPAGRGLGDLVGVDRPVEQRAHAEGPSGQGAGAVLGERVAVEGRRQLRHLPLRRHHHAGERGAALEQQRGGGDPPAVAELTDDVGHRHAHLVEEDLVELGAAVHRRQRADLDAGRVHVGQHEGQPAVLARPIGAHEHLGAVGVLRVGRPPLLAGDDEVIAVDDRLRPHGGEIRSGAGLGEALAEDQLAAQDRRQEPGPLLVGAVGDDRGTGVGQGDEEQVQLVAAGALVLLVEDELLAG